MKHLGIVTIVWFGWGFQSFHPFCLRCSLKGHTRRLDCPTFWATYKTSPERAVGSRIGQNIMNWYLSAELVVSTHLKKAQIGDLSQQYRGQIKAHSKPSVSYQLSTLSLHVQCMSQSHEASRATSEGTNFWSLSQWDGVLCQDSSARFTIQSQVFRYKWQCQVTNIPFALCLSGLR